jgi:hypothetical protein
MSVSGISSSSVAATYTPPPSVQKQVTAPKAISADTVTISKQAQQLVADGDTRAQEASESGGERASETRLGKA